MTCKYLLPFNGLPFHFVDGLFHFVILASFCTPSANLGSSFTNDSSVQNQFFKSEQLREVGGGFRMGNTCTPVVDSCQCMAKPLQYCKVISLQLK